MELLLAGVSSIDEPFMGSSAVARHGTLVAKSPSR